MLSDKATRFKGFTLIELLIVLVILGMMAVLVPPRFEQLMNSAQAKAAARDLVSELRRTRSLAIAEQQEQVLLLDMANKTISTTTTIKLPEEMQISLYTARSEQLSDDLGGIRFFPDGSSTGGRIKLVLQKQTFFIDINWLTGKVAILENIDPAKWNSGDDGFARLNR